MIQINVIVISGVHYNEQ